MIIRSAVMLLALMAVPAFASDFSIGIGVGDGGRYYDSYPYSTSYYSTPYYGSYYSRPYYGSSYYSPYYSRRGYTSYPRYYSRGGSDFNVNFGRSSHSRDRYRRYR